MVREMQSHKIGQYVYHVVPLTRFGLELVIAEDALGVLWYPIRPLCNGLGLAHQKQNDAIKQDSRLAPAAKKVPIPDANFKNAQPTTCLPYQRDEQTGEVLHNELALWLMSIDPTRVRLDETRGKLEDFQRDVLDYATVAIFKRRARGGTLQIVTAEDLAARDRGREVSAEIRFRCQECGAEHCIVLDNGKVHIYIADEITEP
jgi:hypothetical protein